MTYKDRLLEIIEHYKAMSEMNKTNERVVFFSGVKPSNYYVPQVMEYMNHPPYSDQPKETEFSFFVEIWINDLCVFRQSYHGYVDEYNIDAVEEKLCLRMNAIIGMQGMSSSYTFIKDSKNV